MRTGKEQLHKDRFGDEYRKKLNKAWTVVVVVVGKKKTPDLEIQWQQIKRNLKKSK